MSHYQENARDDTPITIAELLEMQPGSKGAPVWINRPIQATIQASEQRQPKKGGAAFVTGTLIDMDTGASIAFSAFGRKFMPPQGTLVEIHGNGTSLTEYNGTNQVTIGQKAVVGTIAEGRRPAAQPAPQRQTPRQHHDEGHDQGGHQPAGHAIPVPGQTVGMAVNNAAMDARTLHEAGTLDLSVSADLKRFIWIRASVYIAVAKQLELGNLANTETKPTSQEAPATEPEPAAEEQPPQPPAAAARQQPKASGFGASRSTTARPATKASADNPHGHAFPTGGEEQDVPF